MRPLTLTKPCGHRVECFGAITPANQTIQVVCERDEDSGLWNYGNPETRKPFRTWAEALTTIDAAIEGTINQLEIL